MHKNSSVLSCQPQAKLLNPRLIIIPGACHTLGGTLITLSALIKGFEEIGAIEKACVLVWADSKMDHYLCARGQEKCVVKIEANTQQQFLEKSLLWASKMPENWPLLLDNVVAKELIFKLLCAAPRLRKSGRSIYHFFHDLALSYHPLGFIARKITFACIAPQALCNSHFTSQHIHRIVPNIQDVLYQPLDFNRFNACSIPSIPENLKPILQKNVRLILTPSRITKPHMVNDKNLRAIVSVVACLKAKGHYYHSVVIGEDLSEGKVYSRQLLELAEQLDVLDRFTILPSTYAIEDYYKHADLVLTLAPREPFGRVVVEAIACGVPVVGSNTGGIGEILGNFAPAWAVPSNDPNQAAEAIVNAMNSSETHLLLHQAQQWVKENCSAAKYAFGIKSAVGL